ncbi:MAG TPA: hypothetical protein VF407_01485 [Polyangiaceae bacterium]
MSDSKKTSEEASWDEPMSHDEDDADHEQKRDTVPPPAGESDAYSAETVIRDIPREVLDVIREEKAKSEKKLASVNPPPPSAPSAPSASAPSEPSVKLEADVPSSPASDADVEEMNKVTARVDASVVAREREKAELEAERARAERDNAAEAERVGNRTTKPVLPLVKTVADTPVTPGELLYAVAGAIVAIVAGFYVVNAFL